MIVFVYYSFYSKLKDSNTFQSNYTWVFFFSFVRVLFYCSSEIRFVSRFIFFSSLVYRVCECECVCVCYFLSCSFQCFYTSKMNPRAVVLRTTFSEYIHRNEISYKLPLHMRSFSLCMCVVYHQTLYGMFSLFCMYRLCTVVLDSFINV